MAKKTQLRTNLFNTLNAGAVGMSGGGWWKIAGLTKLTQSKQFKSKKPRKR